MPPRELRWFNGFDEAILPEPAAAPPFTYGTGPGADHWHGEDVLKMDGIAQATPRDLHRLFSGLSEEKEPTKQWFTTQLHLYGIPYKKTARKSDLKDALEKGFKAGKCDELAPSVAAVRDRLQNEYDKIFNSFEDKKFATIKGGPSAEVYADSSRFVKKYFLDAQDLAAAVEKVPGLAMASMAERVTVGWDTAMGTWVEKEFARLETAYKRKENFQSAQANTDPKFFLKKYLAIDMDGGTTGTKPLVPITLCEWRLQNKQFPEETVNKAPGLHRKDYGEIAVIGWDAASIDKEIAALEAEERRLQEQEEAEERAEREKKEAREKERWDRRCKGYRDLVAKQQQQRPNPFGLQHLPGSYIVQWHGEDAELHAQNNPENDLDVMKINILPVESTHGVAASFNFSLIAGIMLLGMSQRSVELLREEQPKHTEESEHEESDGDEDGYGYMNREPCHRCEKKPARRLGPGATVGEKRSLGQINDPYGVLAARAKRLKTAESQAKPRAVNRVYFQYACREVEGYPVHDVDNEQIGHLDFDETGLAAEGVFYFPDLFGKTALPISVWKIAEKPESSVHLEPWCMYDGRSWGGW